MKTVIRYEIREYQGKSYSRSMSAKLRTREAAKALVKRLNKLGHKDVFMAKIKIAA